MHYQTYVFPTHDSSPLQDRSPIVPTAPSHASFGMHELENVGPRVCPDLVGFAVGAPVVGFPVLESVGAAVAGLPVLEPVGAAVVGLSVGLVVGLPVLDPVGDAK